MGKFAARAAFAIALGLAGPCAAAGMLTTLYSFKAKPDATQPFGPIVVDRAGHIFGAAEFGGRSGQGAVFELTPPAAGSTAWTETVLHSFPKPPGNQSPTSGLIRDRDGNLYGVTSTGGSANCGAVFEMRKTASGYDSRTLHEFQGGAQDGCNSFGGAVGLTLDPGGALYGTTASGGANNSGVAFKLSPPPAGSTAWIETLIFDFSGFEGPGPMLFDAAGNLYGASYSGGVNQAGSVWRLAPPATPGGAWTRTALWSFSGADGVNPTGPLVANASGALYGTCLSGGANGNGSAFKLAPPAAGSTAWTESTLFSFRGNATNGGHPVGGLARASHGELIVPMTAGLKTGPAGAIVELRPPGQLGTGWTERVLWSFTGGADGATPTAPPLLLPGSLMIGAAYLGGANGQGTVWQLAW